MDHLISFLCSLLSSGRLLLTDHIPPSRLVIHRASLLSGISLDRKCLDHKPSKSLGSKKVIVTIWADLLLFLFFSLLDAGFFKMCELQIVE